MSDFNTIHIFGFGKIQVVGENGGMIDANLATTLPDFVAHLITLAPPNFIAEDYHVIHIFKNFHVKYISKSGESLKFKNNFLVKFDKLDESIYSGFITEVLALVD